MASQITLKNNILNLSNNLITTNMSETSIAGLIEKTKDEWSTAFGNYLSEVIVAGVQTSLTEETIKTAAYGGLSLLGTTTSLTSFVEVLLLGMDAAHAAIALAATTGATVATPPATTVVNRTTAATSLTLLMSVQISNPEIFAQGVSLILDTYTKTGISVVGSAAPVNWL